MASQRKGEMGLSHCNGVTKPVLAEKNVGRWENRIPTVKDAFLVEINSFEYDIMFDRPQLVKPTDNLNDGA